MIICEQAFPSKFSKPTSENHGHLQRVVSIGLRLAMNTKLLCNYEGQRCQSILALLEDTNSLLKLYRCTNWRSSTLGFSHSFSAVLLLTLEINEY